MSNSVEVKDQLEACCRFVVGQTVVTWFLEVNWLITGKRGQGDSTEYQVREVEDALGNGSNQELGWLTADYFTNVKLVSGEQL
jgi:hypothetical protein